MRRVLQLLVTALAVTGVAVGLGLLISLDDGGPPAAAPPPTATAVPPTPLADLDTTHLAVARAAFCDAVAADDVVAALGAEPDGQSTYVDHERTEITPLTTDVAHEFDCTWSLGQGADAVTARAWVFAPPVTPARAASLARGQVRARACDPLTDAAAFGSPSAATTCATRRGVEVSYRGLFGDAWLVCSLTEASTATTTAAATTGLPDRAQAWCSAVAQAASA